MPARLRFSDQLLHISERTPSYQDFGEVDVLELRMNWGHCLGNEINGVSTTTEEQLCYLFSFFFRSVYYAVVNHWRKLRNFGTGTLTVLLMGIDFFGTWGHRSLQRNSFKIWSNAMANVRTGPINLNSIGSLWEKSCMSCWREIDCLLTAVGWTWSRLDMLTAVGRTFLLKK